MEALSIHLGTSLAKSSVPRRTLTRLVAAGQGRRPTVVRDARRSQTLMRDADRSHGHG